MMLYMTVRRSVRGISMKVSKPTPRILTAARVPHLLRRFVPAARSGKAALASIVHTLPA
jgi:hypothetical protein